MLNYPNQWLFGALYLIGLYLFVQGYTRYKTNIWWILLVFLGPYPLFILHEWKRRDFQRKTLAPGEKLHVADKRVRASIWFSVLSMVFVFFSGVGIFYTIMDGTPVPDAIRMGSNIQFWGLVFLATGYGAIIYRYHFIQYRR